MCLGSRFLLSSGGLYDYPANCCRDMKKIAYLWSDILKKYSVCYCFEVKRHRQTPVALKAMVDAHVICVGIFLVGYGRLAMPLYQRGMPTFFMRIREQRQGDTDRNLKLKIKNNAKSSTNPCRHPDAWLMLQRQRGI